MNQPEHPTWFSFVKGETLEVLWIVNPPILETHQLLGIKWKPAMWHENRRKIRVPTSWGFGCWGFLEGMIYIYTVYRLHIIVQGMMNIFYIHIHLSMYVLYIYNLLTTSRNFLISTGISLPWQFLTGGIPWPPNPRDSPGVPNAAGLVSSLRLLLLHQISSFFCTEDLQPLWGIERSRCVTIGTFAWSLCFVSFRKGGGNDGNPQNILSKSYSI